MPSISCYSADAELSFCAYHNCKIPYDFAGISYLVSSDEGERQHSFYFIFYDCLNRTGKHVKQLICNVTMKIFLIAAVAVVHYTLPAVNISR